MGGTSALVVARSAEQALGQSAPGAASACDW
jgi:hypothetical protein